MDKLMIRTDKGKYRYIVDLEVDGVDTKDYPDFCDAYLSAATWDDTGKALSDSELDTAQEQLGGVINQIANEDYCSAYDFFDYGNNY